MAVNKCKIGQIIIANQDIEVNAFLSDEKKIIPKGSKVIIGADKFAHHLSDGMIQPLSGDIAVKGYDAVGLAKYIMGALDTDYQIMNILSAFEIEKEELEKHIAFFLMEIGFN